MKQKIFILFIIIFFTISALAQKVKYLYDKAGRLIQVTYPNQTSVNYTYDNDGNRILKTVSTVLLPVQLLSFNATKQEKDVLLTWSTSQEFNSDKFEVEFSKDGRTFEKFISVAAKGNTSTRSDYSTIHCCPITGVNYYRLKMIDKDAMFKYSEIRQVKFDFVNEMTVYPNPVSKLATINISFTKGFESDGSVVIYDSKGSQVINTVLKKGTILLPINIQALASGRYIIKVIIKEEIFESTFVKQ